MITDQAFVLHKRAYKDSSELIKLLTLNHGIIDVIAKGSQRPKSKLKGQLQPFTHTQINVVGKSALKTLIDAEQNAVLPRCDYINHVSMLYCNELLVLLKLDEEAVNQIFMGYRETIKQLSTAKTVSLALREFEWQLCRSTGYELTLPSHIQGIDFIEFSHDDGLVKDASKRLCQAQTWSDFMAKKPLNNEQLRQLSRLMKTVIKYMVGGKTIQSRQLLNKTFDSHSYL